MKCAKSVFIQYVICYCSYLRHYFQALCLPCCFARETWWCPCCFFFCTSWFFTGILMDPEDQRPESIKLQLVGGLSGEWGILTMFKPCLVGGDWLPWILFSQKYWESHHPNWLSLHHFSGRGFSPGPPTVEQLWLNWPINQGDERKQYQWERVNWWEWFISWLVNIDMNIIDIPLKGWTDRFIFSDE